MWCVNITSVYRDVLYLTYQFICLIMLAEAIPGSTSNYRQLKNQSSPQASKVSLPFEVSLTIENSPLYPQTEHVETSSTFHRVQVGALCGNHIDITRYLLNLIAILGWQPGLENFIIPLPKIGFLGLWWMCYIIWSGQCPSESIILLWC